MSTFTNTAREVEMPNGDVVVIHNAPTGGENTTSNIKKFKYDDNGHVTESTAADAEDLNLSGYSTPTTGTTAIGTSDDVQTAIGKLDHQSHIDQTNILLVKDATEELVDNGAKNVLSWSLEEAKRINTDGTWSGNVYTHNGVTYTVNSDMTVNLSMVPGTTTHSRSVFKLSESVSNSYTNSYVLSSGNTYMSSDSFALYAEETDSPWTDIAIDYGTGTIISSTVQSVYSVYIAVKADYVLSITHTVKPMISTKAAWDVSHEYEQYAKSNAQLTRDCTVNNSRIYAQATEPTDIDIPEGSTWANGASVKGYERTDNLFDEKYTGITGATVGTTYYPIQVGTGDFTLSTTTPNSTGTGSLLFLLAGNVSEGASSSANGVHNGMSRTVTAVNGYVTVAYRYDNNYNPKNYQTMLNAGSSALPYVPYLEWQADPALVEQIDAGAKNKLKLDKDAIKSLNSGGTWSGYVYTPTTAPNLTVTINDDSTVTLNGSTSSSLVTVALERKASSGFQGYVLSGSKANTKLVYQLAVSPYTVYATADGVGSAVIANYTDGSTIQLSLQIVANSTFSNTVITPMICTEADWNVSQKHVPPALPNYDLTVREAEDRKALAEVVDSGAKNVVDTFDLDAIKALNTNGTWNGNIYSYSNVDFAFNSDGSITVNRTAASSTEAQLNLYALSSAEGRTLSLDTGDYYVTGGKSATKFIRVIIINGSVRVREYNCTDDTLITTQTGYNIYVSLRIAATESPSNELFKIMITTKAKYDISPAYEPPALPNTDLTRMMTPFFTVPINHNMIYRGQNLGDTLTADQDTALSSGNFTDLYLGDYWTKQITIPAFYEVTAAEPADWSTNYTSYYTKSGDTYTPVTGDTAPTWAANTYCERLVPSQTVTLKAVIADFDTFYAGYASGYAAINSHHAAVIVHGFNNVVWNKTNTTAGGYVNSLIHKWLVNSALPQIETWFGSAKVLSHQKLLTNAITGDAASGWAWSSQKISLLSENQMYGSKVWGNSKATNGAYEPGEAFKHLNVFNHIDANLLFGNKNIWLRDIASAGWVARLIGFGFADSYAASDTWIAPAALILLS